MARYHRNSSFYFVVSLFFLNFLIFSENKFSSEKNSFFSSSLVFSSSSLCSYSSSSSSSSSWLSSFLLACKIGLAPSAKKKADLFSFFSSSRSEGASLEFKFAARKKPVVRAFNFASSSSFCVFYCFSFMCTYWKKQQSYNFSWERNFHLRFPRHGGATFCRNFVQNTERCRRFRASASLPAVASFPRIANSSFQEMMPQNAHTKSSQNTLDVRRKLLMSNANNLLPDPPTYPKPHSFHGSLLLGTKKKGKKQTIYNEEIRELLATVQNCHSSIELLSKLAINSSLLPLPYPVCVKLLIQLGDLYEKERKKSVGKDREQVSIFSALNAYRKYLPYLRSILSGVYVNIKLFVNKKFHCVQKKGELVMNIYAVRREDIQRIFQALSKLGLKEEKLLIHVLQKTLGMYADDFTSEETCQIADSLANLELVNMQSWVAEALDRIENRGGGIKQTDDALLVKLLRSLAVLNVARVPFVKKLSSHFITRLEMLDAKQCATILKSLATMEYFEEEVYENLGAQFLNKISDLTNPQKSFVNVLRAMSAVGFKHDLLLMSMAKEICKHLNTFNHEELATILRAYSLLNYYPKELFTSVFNSPFWDSVASLAQQNEPRVSQTVPQKAKGVKMDEEISEITYMKFYQAYMAFKIESSFADEFSLPPAVVDYLKCIFRRNIEAMNCSTSSIHHDVAKIFKEEFGIKNNVEYLTPEGLILDIAILPHHLNSADISSTCDAQNLPVEEKTTNNTYRYAVEVQGPFHYLQKSLLDFPPKFNGATQFKHRLLRALGWEVVCVPYWILASWYTTKRKAAYIEKILPDELLQRIYRIKKNKNLERQKSDEILTKSASSGDTHKKEYETPTKKEEEKINEKSAAEKYENSEEYEDDLLPKLKSLDELLQPGNHLGEMLRVIRNTLFHTNKTKCIYDEASTLLQ